MLIAASSATLAVALFFILQDWNAEILVSHLKAAKIADETIQGIVRDYKRGLLKILMSIVGSVASSNLCILFYFRMKKEI